MTGLPKPMPPGMSRADVPDWLAIRHDPWRPEAWPGIPLPPGRIEPGTEVWAKCWGSWRPALFEKKSRRLLSLYVRRGSGSIERRSLEPDDVRLPDPEAVAERRQVDAKVRASRVRQVEASRFVVNTDVAGDSSGLPGYA